MGFNSAFKVIILLALTTHQTPNSRNAKTCYSGRLHFFLM